MTTFDIFIGALLALSVYELIHIAAKELFYRINSKKRLKEFDDLLANLTSLSYDDDCDLCDDDWVEVKPAKKKTAKKAVAKKRK